MEKADVLNVLEEELGKLGTFLSGSKSSYRTLHPDNFVIFNSNIITNEHGKIWWGDFDTAIDGIILKNIAERLNITFYVLKEHDARFDKENDPVDVLISRSIWNTAKELNERPKTDKYGMHSRY